MVILNYRSLLILLAIFLLSSTVKAQSCGFGCLGLGGIYGGYSVHYYQADGLNEMIQANLTSRGYSDSFSKFEYGKGFRVGANIFRAKFDNYFISAKGFYQFLKEKHSYNLASLKTRENYELQLNHWGVGVDFGVPLFRILDLKIIEGGLNFYSTKVNTEVNSGENTVVNQYESNKTKLGYYVSSGFILHLVKDYISIEGTAVYNMVSVDNVENQDGEFLFNEPDKVLINRGGFSAAIQLNVGVTF